MVTKPKKAEFYAIHYDGMPLAGLKDYDNKKYAYTTPGMAKLGMLHVPDDLDESKLEIVRYVPDSSFDEERRLLRQALVAAQSFLPWHDTGYDVGHCRVCQQFTHMSYMDYCRNCTEKLVREALK